MGILEASRHKSLMTAIEKEKGAKAVCELNIAENRRKIKQHSENIERLNKRINGISRKEGLLLSEHAILRYLERVELIPIEQVKEKVVTEKLIEIYEAIGDGAEIPFGDGGHTCVVKNGIVITIR